MWEYDFHDNKFEVVIRVRHHPCVDALTLNSVSQRLADLSNDVAERVKTIMSCEYCERSAGCNNKVNGESRCEALG